SEPARRLLPSRNGRKVAQPRAPSSHSSRHALLGARRRRRWNGRSNLVLKESSLVAVGGGGGALAELKADPRSGQVVLDGRGSEPGRELLAASSLMNRMPISTPEAPRA